MKRSCRENRTINNYRVEAKRRAKADLHFLVNVRSSFYFCRFYNEGTEQTFLELIADSVAEPNSIHLPVRVMVMSFPELSKLKCSWWIRWSFFLMFSRYSPRKPEVWTV